MKNILVVFLMLVALGATSQNYGYIVTVNNNRESGATQSLKTESIQDVQQIIYKNTGVMIESEKIFEGDNVFFEYRNNGVFLYCEKKIVDYKSNGKLVLRKIKQKEAGEALDQLAERGRN